ncbi:small glutamine-rich tetratricopeptide repeat-containing protein alpha isoform X2 [Protopterus annectens]|uniref:small glutamine-rich tetratricopeptide repeat-containing protein alpha isoform X2 n=1 Tax=Protopterus annectens TaxID=7888 RepID=UPI001CFA5D59|nr:small glutamine-rich tetratricopeptide repeat-containing protein alpha isoform X2 [Protopterus annectens]
MTDTKRLAYSIVQFLKQQLSSGELSSDAQESLEVAIQCLETAFSVSAEDHDLAVPQSLPEIFASAIEKGPPHITVNSVSATPSEDDLGEAERLKTEGNEQMKVENYESAVSFYTLAIDRNPRNAVYYCNRAAAYSKMGNYEQAVQDCEKAIEIDPNYSKAYGRMGLALASLNRHTDAVLYYKKALGLDPENETYRSNLKIAEQKMKEASSPASSLMTNPQVQHLLSGMLSSQNPLGTAGANPTTNDLSSLIHAGQQFAQQMQQENPELIEQLRSHIRSRTPSASNEEAQQ